MEIALKELKSKGNVEGMEEDTIINALNDKTDNPLIMSMIKEKTEQYKAILKKIQKIMKDTNTFAEQVIKIKKLTAKTRFIYSRKNSEIQTKIISLIDDVNKPDIKTIQDLKNYLNMNKSFDELISEINNYETFIQNEINDNYKFTPEKEKKYANDLIFLTERNFKIEIKTFESGNIERTNHFNKNKAIIEKRSEERRVGKEC